MSNYFACSLALFSENKKVYFLVTSWSHLFIMIINDERCLGMKNKERRVHSKNSFVSKKIVMERMKKDNLHFGWQLDKQAMEEKDYYELIQPYTDAMNLLLARLEVLNHTIYSSAGNKAIHTIQNRIKKKESVEEKLIKRGYEPTVENAKNQLQDIAGIRIVCYFTSDIDKFVSILKKQPDLICMKERDYIRNPKPNGYRSYHLILGVNVCCLDANEYFPVEIQIRTLSMDFWAAMEHRVSYKKDYINKEQRVQELLNYSNILTNMEKEFEKYNDI